MQVPVLFRRVISLKAICEKVEFSNCDFVIVFVIITDIHVNYSKSYFNDFKPRTKGR